MGQKVLHFCDEIDRDGADDFGQDGEDEIAQNHWGKTALVLQNNYIPFYDTWD